MCLQADRLLSWDFYGLFKESWDWFRVAFGTRLDYKLVSTTVAKCCVRCLLPWTLSLHLGLLVICACAVRQVLAASSGYFARRQAIFER